MKVEIYSILDNQFRCYDLDVTKEQLERWRGGELIQKVMPNLNADEREFLIHGTEIPERKDYGILSEGVCILGSKIYSPESSSLVEEHEIRVMNVVKNSVAVNIAMNSTYGSKHNNDFGYPETKKDYSPYDFKNFSYRELDKNHNRYSRFYFSQIPCVIHVIKSGREGEFFVYMEEPYDRPNLEMEILTQSEILNKFGINLYDSNLLNDVPKDCSSL